MEGGWKKCGWVNGSGLDEVDRGRVGGGSGGMERGGGIKWWGWKREMIGFIFVNDLRGMVKKWVYG